jgi:iron complex outermembrane receptor protein
MYAHDSKTLETVTVTANKVEENIQDVPQSITVIDAEEIEEKGIKTIEDVIAEIPNMTTTPDRGVKVNFRGLNASLFADNNPVVIYIDGIPTSHKYDFGASLENVERIEVLRGPQGTLYGKDSIGGVINIVTQEPTNETTGSVGVEYGSDNYRRATFNINTPIVENKLFFNLNAEGTFDDSWVTNELKNDDDAAKSQNKRISTAFYYKPTDRLSTRLVLKKEKTRKHEFKGYGVVGQTGLDLFKRDDAEHTSFDMNMVEENDIDSQSFNLKYEADGFNVESVTVHKETDLDGKYDTDYTSGTVFDGTFSFNDAESDAYSQEIRISSTNSDTIRWVTGIYLDKEENKKKAYGFAGPAIGGINDTVSTSDSKTQAIFGQAVIPFAQEWELTLGGRYQRIKKEMDLTAYYTPSGTGITSVTNEFEPDKTWNVFLPKVALSYKFNENITSFASISKGYMPGGFNVVATTSNQEENEFDAQQSVNYEMGIKGSFENFMFTASIFRMNIKDIHTYRTVGLNKFTDNADKAHSQGVEFDFRYFPINELEINGAVGFIRTKYDDYKLGDNDFSGERIETTPSSTASLGIAYYHPQGFYARTDVKHQGSMYFHDDQAREFVKVGSRTLLDLKLGYKVGDWDLYAYAKNLTDKEYINTYETNSSFSFATFGAPRFIGVGAKYKF